MAEATFTPVARPQDPAGRVLDLACRALAICAGIVLTLMALMSVISIIGRSFFDSPIKGDYEMVQMMSAVAVAMSLPFCQMARGHVIVDFFTAHLAKPITRMLDAIAGILLAGVSFVIAWRIGVGMVELRSNGDATMLLSLPTWWGYAPMVPSFFLLGAAALYTAWKDMQGDAQ